ncbi:oligoendopeptidase F [Gynuella sp.]|uniref:oligoendopeptidase F n=1 Tax=Gynuella sp. TaxID=2969146 RepID=UPI003D0CB0B9
MHKSLTAALLSFGLLLAPAGFAEAEESSMEDPRYTWDLTDIYPSKEAWNQAREAALADLKKIEEYKGTLGKNARHLFEGLEVISNSQQKVSKIYTYASLLTDENLQIPEHQEMEQLASIMYGQLGEATSWLEPEILAIGAKKIKRFLRKEPALQPYRFYLENTLRQAPYTLDAKGESLLAGFSTPLDAPSTIYSLIANSDIPWPEVTLSNGQSYRIDSQGYRRWRASENREDRKKVFNAYWSRWQEYRSSVGAVLNSHIQNQVALAKARGYDSVLQRELHTENIPEDVYRTLVKEVNEALPTLHRYFKLREKILGIDQMHYYDIYPPLVSLDKTFDYETSKTITLDAMSILGDDWVKRQTEGMNDQWVHAFPQKGKRSGAYMNGSLYDVHPYLLLNHQDDYDSLSTMAHEWGHAMHTLYAIESQPVQTFDYSTFIAEIPSTSLELILQEYMTEHAQTAQEKIFYLGSSLENLRGTFFRQTMFAEFELALYEKVENGEALTGEKISQIYGEILKRYHGTDQHVVEIDDLYTNEWMFVPHFYYNMYVYQYATSITAGTALYERIVEEGEAGVENYKNLLRAGGSDYPYVLLKNAGVDLATPEPFKAIIKRMNLIMDEMEALLAESDSSNS